MFDYGVGGQERKSNTGGEGIADIPINRTLFIEKLTADPPIKPQVVYDLKTVEEVFEHFKPQQEVGFTTEDGSFVNETLQFRGLAHFGKKGVIDQSPFLQNLNSQFDDLQKLIRQLKSNKILKTALENSDAKANYLAAIQALIAELEETQP